jgi:hypothetical protein
MREHYEYENKRRTGGKRTGKSRQNVSSLVLKEKMSQKGQCHEHELRLWREMHD